MEGCRANSARARYAFPIPTLFLAPLHPLLLKQNGRIKAPSNLMLSCFFLLRQKSMLRPRAKMGGDPRSNHPLLELLARWREGDLADHGKELFSRYTTQLACRLEARKPVVAQAGWPGRCRGSSCPGLAYRSLLRGRGSVRDPAQWRPLEASWPRSLPRKLYRQAQPGTPPCGAQTSRVRPAAVGGWFETTGCSASEVPGSRAIARRGRSAVVDELEQVTEV